MAENIEKLILDDSGFINPLKESIKVMEEAEKAFKDLNNAQAQGGQKAANEIKKASEVQQKIKTFVIRYKGFRFNGRKCNGCWCGFSISRRGCGITR